MSSSPDPDEEPETPHGTVTPTAPGPLVIAGVLALVLGWAIRPLALRMGYLEPDVSLLTILLLFFAAAVIAATAYFTRRTVQRSRIELTHREAVGRLALGKACAFAGALLVGGYLGYAVAQLGIDDPASATRLWRSCLAAVGAALVMGAALLLELACRVPKPPE